MGESMKAISYINDARK